MRISNFRIAVLISVTSVLISGYNSQTYSELEALEAACPERDKCEGYRYNLTYMDRSCECDNNCIAYKDCCVDAPALITQASRSAVRTNVKCLHYGQDDHTGVYVISKCSDSWTGSTQIREKCVRNDDYSDPLAAAPVTDISRNKTYRNMACARCNNANTTSLKIFQLKLDCSGLEDMSQEQILTNLTFSQQNLLWGVIRLNRFRNGTEFIGCNIIFDVPGYLNNSVRFCRSNLISKCASNWRRPTVAEKCAKYMAVVYSNTAAYRNVHCALCNRLTVDEVACTESPFTTRRRPMSFVHLLDINQSDGDQVGISAQNCPPNHKYDPYTKTCRDLVCLFDDQVLVDGRCVSG